MSGVLRLALLRARRAILGPVGLALLAWLALAALTLPTVQAVALSAAPRALADLGLLGLRLALLVAGIALGTTAVGPPLRRGAVDLWRARGLRVSAWIAARLAGTLLPLGAALLVGTCAWCVLDLLLGHQPPTTLAPWLGLAALELLVVTCLTTLTSTALRGPAGPVVALVWLGVGRLSALATQAQGPAALVGRLLRWIAPNGDLLDGQAVLVGAAPATPAALTSAAVHGLGWALACVLLTVILARRIDAR